MTQTGKREVLFEMRRQGNFVKVSAIDVTLNIEISIVGDVRAGEHALKMAALRRLDMVIAKGQGGK